MSAHTELASVRRSEHPGSLAPVVFDAHLLVDAALLLNYQATECRKRWLIGVGRALSHLTKSNPQQTPLQVAGFCVVLDADIHSSHCVEAILWDVLNARLVTERTAFMAEILKVQVHSRCHIGDGWGLITLSNSGGRHMLAINPVVLIHDNTNECQHWYSMLQPLSKALSVSYHQCILAPALRRAEILLGLSNRQRDVLEMLLQGRTEPEMSDILHRSRHTIHDHVRMVYEHFHVHNRAELVARWHALMSAQEEHVEA